MIILPSTPIKGAQSMNIFHTRFRWIALILCFVRLNAYELIQFSELLYREDYTPHWVPITALKIDPSHEHLFFSLAKNTEEKGGMHYDQISIYRVLKNGQRLYATTSPDTMRNDLLTLKEHMNCFKNTHPKANVFAISSYGNLIMDGFLAGYSEGQVIMRDDEPSDRSYFSLVVSKEGAVQFQDISYSKGHFEKDAQIISGQAVVRNGVPIKASSIFDQFDNIKHLFHLPFLHSEGRTLHFAVDQLTADREKLKLAAGGQRVILELKAYQLGKEGDMPVYTSLAEDLLRRGLKEKGYRQLASFNKVLKPGEYSIQKEHIAICFLPALNAHHFIALDRAGFLLDLIVQGKSNREGISLEKAGEWLIERFDIQDAIVIDNGADCMLSYQDQLIVPSFNGRSKIASALIYFKDHQSVKILSSDHSR